MRIDESTTIPLFTAISAFGASIGFAFWISSVSYQAQATSRELDRQRDNMKQAFSDISAIKSSQAAMASDISSIKYMLEKKHQGL